MIAEHEETWRPETGDTDTNSGPRATGPTSEASAGPSPDRASASDEASAPRAHAAAGPEEPRTSAGAPDEASVDSAARDDGAASVERAVSADGADQVESAESAESTLDPVAQLREVQAEAERYRSNWQRATADLINYRRRADQEKEDAIKYGSVHLLKALLPIIDDLERAIANAPAEIAGTSWFEGLQMLSRKIATSLQSQGVEAIEAVGRPFDPTLHEAVLYEEGEEGKVTAEFQKGYRLHGRVVRPSLVRVGSGQRAAEG